MKKFLAVFFSLILFTTPIFAADQTISWTDTNAMEDGYKVDVSDNTGNPLTTLTTGPNATSVVYDCTISECCYEVYAFAAGLMDSTHSTEMCLAIPVLNVPSNVNVSN